MTNFYFLLSGLIFLGLFTIWGRKDVPNAILKFSFLLLGLAGIALRLGVTVP